MKTENRKALVLMRGCAGSGKSSLANILKLDNRGVICSTDDYFVRNGNYNFDRYKIGNDGMPIGVRENLR